MNEAKLKASKRVETGSSICAKLRRAQLVPGIVYGHKQEPVKVSVKEDDLAHVLHEGGHVVNLDIEGADQPALIREVQYDAFGEVMLHVDFYRIDMDEEVDIEVPIEFHGTPAGIEMGGNLDLGLHEINVSCKATAIPESIRAEVGQLEIGDTLHVRDLELPQGVKLLTDEEVVVAHVRPPVVEEAPVAEEGAEEGAAEVEGAAGEEGAAEEASEE